MVHDIILGRTLNDLEKYGTRGAIFIGKQYITMGKTVSLANRILLDVAKPHLVLICGKRGGGKSYTMGVITEAMVQMPEEVSHNLAVLIFDTMGIYWTMKYPNYRDEALLNDWGMEPAGFEDKVFVYVPLGLYNKFKESGVPVDKPFSLSCKEITSIDWCMLFGIPVTSLMGILITRIISGLMDDNLLYSLDELIERINADKKADPTTKDAVINMFQSVKPWGLFTKEGSKSTDLLRRGKTSVLDISGYAHVQGGFSIRALVIGLVSKKILEERMIARKIEELNLIQKGYRALEEMYKESEKITNIPQVWLFIDEAHEFLPREGETLASGALIQVIREGRQPGVSLVLATQQPGKVHTDVITQSDVVISHRLTARIDIEALNQVMQTYLAGDIQRYLDTLPGARGCAIVLDDKLERMYPFQIRPRITWHGGAEPEMLKPEEK